MKFASSLTKLILTLIFIASIVSIIIVLWQRQPQIKDQTQKAVVEKIESQALEEKDFEIKPEDGEVIANTKVKLSGKSKPEYFLAILTDESQTVTKTDKDGKFTADLDLANGYNLINFNLISSDLSNQEQKNLNLYVDSKFAGKRVIAGSVKTLFDNLITISSTKDINVRTSKDTNFDIPTPPAGGADEKEATNAVDNVRVGDFAIALGDLSDEDTLMASNVEILRENKPQITKLFALGQTVSAVKSNIFSVKNNDGNLIELKLDNKSEVNVDGKKSAVKDIVKDKKAFVFYSPGDDNIVDLVYILP